MGTVHDAPPPRPQGQSPFCSQRVAPTMMDALGWARQMLAQAGLPEAEREARVLVREVLGLSEADLILRKEAGLSEEQLRVLSQAVARRAQREPLAYITGRAHFLRWEL